MPAPRQYSRRAPMRYALQNCQAGIRSLGRGTETCSLDGPNRCASLHTAAPVGRRRQLGTPYRPAAPRLFADRRNGNSLFLHESACGGNTPADLSRRVFRGLERRTDRRDGYAVSAGREFRQRALSQRECGNVAPVGRRSTLSWQRNRQRITASCGELGAAARLPVSRARHPRARRPSDRLLPAPGLWRQGNIAVRGPALP